MERQGCQRCCSISRIKRSWIIPQCSPELTESPLNRIPWNANGNILTGKFPASFPLKFSLPIRIFMRVEMQCSGMRTEFLRWEQSAPEAWTCLTTIQLPIVKPSVVPSNPGRLAVRFLHRKIAFLLEHREPSVFSNQIQSSFRRTGSAQALTNARVPRLKRASRLLLASLTKNCLVFAIPKQKMIPRTRRTAALGCLHRDLCSSSSWVAQCLRLSMLPIS